MRTRAPAGLLLFLARRGLGQSPLTVALMIGAVAAGVGFQIPNGANAAGYRREILIQGVSAGSGDVRVRPRRGLRIAAADSLAAELVRRAGFVAAVPVLMAPGAVGRSGDLRGVVVMGLDGAAARLPFRLSEGGPLAAGDADGVILGSTLARRLSLRPGDSVQLRVILGSGGGGLLGAAGDGDRAVGAYTLEVRGIAAGSFLAPEAVIVDRAFLANELGAPGAASTIFCYGDDPERASERAAAVNAAFPAAEASAWRVDNPFVSGAVDSAVVLGRLSAVMVVLAVIIPVWALFYIHVLHRQRQIALLGAIGIGRAEVFAVHLLQALMVGVAGVAAGCGLGFALVRWFDAHPLFRMDTFVVRPAADLGVFLWPALLVLGATVAAGVLPAWRAARIDPARVLRGME